MNKNIWSDAEINYLVNNYSQLTIKELQKNIDKTRKQIIRELEKRGLQYLTEKEKEKLEWTREQDEFLIKNYSNNTITELSKVLNKDYHKVKRRIDFLNINKINQNDRILKSKINNIDEQLLDIIKKQTRYMIVSDIAKYHNLKISEINNICKYYNIDTKNKFELLNEIDSKIKKIGNGKSISYISKKLNLDYNLVFRRCNKIGIEYVNDYPKWSKKEKNKLIELSKDTSLDDIALIMKRSKGSILENAKKLNISIIKNKYIDTTNLSDTELEYLKTQYNNKPLKEICSHINKDSRTVILKMHLLNLYKTLNYSNTSLLESVIAKILDEYNIKYECQYKIENETKKVICDFKLINSNKIIEVYGDFWHGYDIPGKTNDPRDLVKIRQNNKIKENFITNNGYELLIIWEHDIIDNLEKTYDIIYEYVKS